MSSRTEYNWMPIMVFEYFLFAKRLSDKSIAPASVSELFTRNFLLDNVIFLDFIL
jgi:hypothetical protein